MSNISNECEEIRKVAKECLLEMPIIDGDVFINNLLFELSETDDTNISLKKIILDNILTFLKNNHKK